MGKGEEFFNLAVQQGKNMLKQATKKMMISLLGNPIFWVAVIIFFLIIIIAGVMIDESSTVHTGNMGEYTNVGDSNFSGEGLVEIAQGLHDFIRENQYAYSCSDNVSNGYSNSCTCNSTSHFAINNFDEFDNIKCIDCSAYVSWVLNQYLGSDKFPTRWWSGDFANESKWISGWQKININDIQAGDILWKNGHVGIYIGNGYTLEAGSTNTIRSQNSYNGNIQSIINNYEFAIRIP